MIPDMRKRILALVGSLAVGLTLLVAAPATADYAVTIDFPGTVDEFYSPFDGPAMIGFTFDGSEPDETFRVRLRPAGGSVIHSADVFVDADDPDGTHQRAFRWPALSVANPKTYEVAVYRDGNFVTSEFFQLRPKLVQILSANPNPFLPWIDDDIKDETRIRYELSNGTQSTEARVFKANLQGKCCGTRKLTEDLGARPAGINPWVWDGRDDGNDLLPKGDYFVRIWGEDSSGVSGISNTLKVTIARTYRATTTIQKNGINYHHTGPVTSYRRGGNCFVTKDETDKDLWITCLSASFTVYWRWNLPDGSRLEQAKFVLVPVSGNICGAKKGHTRTDTYMKVGGVGQFRCRVDLAKAVYSYPVQS
jgi:hypothetical protein